MLKALNIFWVIHFDYNYFPSDDGPRPTAGVFARGFQCQKSRDSGVPRSGGTRGAGARAPQQLPLNGQRLIPRPPAKCQMPEWEGGNNGRRTGWRSDFGQSNNGQRNRFEYEMRLAHNGSRNGSRLDRRWTPITLRQLEPPRLVLFWTRNRIRNLLDLDWSFNQWQLPLECANFQSRTSIFAWT